MVEFLLMFASFFVGAFVFMGIAIWLAVLCGFIPRATTTETSTSGTVYTFPHQLHSEPKP